jgi:hypothetical protein
LASRLLDESGDVMPGFVLVVGDEIVADVGSLTFEPGHDLPDPFTGWGLTRAGNASWAASVVCSRDQIRR